MALHHTTPILARVGLIATIALNAASVRAAASDYRFEVTGVKAAGAGKTDVALRLFHVADKEPVSGAVVFQVSADMAPDGRPTIKAPANAMPPSQPGLYIIEVEPGVAGNWALRLAAKVPGEAETIRATVPIKLGK